jgi:hypothetical protein
MDALLPTFYFGQPIVGYRGRFDPERALRLMEKYQVRNTFLFPTALKLMMKAFPPAARALRREPAQHHERGRGCGTTVFAWAQEALGVTINEMFGQTEMNYIVGNSHTQWPAKPGSMGRPYPGHRIAVIDDSGNPVPQGEPGEVAIHRVAPDGTADPVFFLEYLNNTEGTRRNTPGTGAAPATSRPSTQTAISGIRAARMTCSRSPDIALGPQKSRTASSSTRRSPMPRSSRCPMQLAAMWSRRSSCLRRGTCLRRRYRRKSSFMCGNSWRRTNIRRKSNSSTRCR